MPAYEAIAESLTKLWNSYEKSPTYQSVNDLESRRREAFVQLRKLMRAIDMQSYTDRCGEDLPIDEQNLKTKASI
jgi:hypothetical protein